MIETTKERYRRLLAEKRTMTDTRAQFDATARKANKQAADSLLPTTGRGISVREETARLQSNPVTLPTTQQMINEMDSKTSPPDVERMLSNFPADDDARAKAVAASISRRKWVAAEKPIAIGQPRIMKWRAQVIPPDGSSNSMWQQRCADYWFLQQRIYGYRCAPPVLEFEVVEDIDPADPMRTLKVPLAITSTVILEIFPGERLTKRAWAAWRLANPNVE